MIFLLWGFLDKWLTKALIRCNCAFRFHIFPELLREIDTNSGVLHQDRKATQARGSLKTKGYMDMENLGAKRTMNEIHHSSSIEEGR